MSGFKKEQKRFAKEITEQIRHRLLAYRDCAEITMCTYDLETLIWYIDYLKNKKGVTK